MAVLISSLDTKSRFFISVALLILSLLLLGAGRITGALNQRSSDRKSENLMWSTTISAFGKEVPREHKTSWTLAIENNPQLFLRINTSNIEVFAKN